MAQLRTFPHNFEEKIGFDSVRILLAARTRSIMGRECIARLFAIDDYNEIKERLARIGELLQIRQEGRDFPSLSLQDLRSALNALLPLGTYLPEEKLPHLAQLIRTIEELYRFLGYQEKATDVDEGAVRYPALLALLPDGLLLPHIAQRIEQMLDRFGKIQDSASPLLREIRTERSVEERNISRKIRSLLTRAIEEGWAEENARPSLRDGHPVIPIIPSYKRNIPGIVHDESGTGKTLFVEPLEIVESNNRIRELEAAERREIIRILTLLADDLRPHLGVLQQMYQVVGVFDSLLAISQFAYEEKAIIPRLQRGQNFHWLQARHPLLRRTLEAENRLLVPIDIALKAPEARILLISGPNAGGKSVCLKTCGLLQYMLQMGIPIPVHPDSMAGIFRSIAINIGDDQSLEDDLSTYSSHLVSMRHFCHIASPTSLLLIDEFGAGTEPELGGAIAEALLEAFNDAKSFAIITTHYRNLKQLATERKGLINGAMLYDRSAMRPLFKLSIGQPGSSFALQIARKSGLPMQVLQKAEALVGKEQIDAEKYVQEIARDKQYWQQKKDSIRKREKQVEEQYVQYTAALERLKTSRKEVLEEAQQQAQQLLSNTNAQIERTIREIRESNAQREKTLEARKKLTQFSQEVATKEGEEKLSDSIDREWQRIEARRKRKAEKRQKRESQAFETAPKKLPLEVGCTVQISTQPGIEGKILSLKGSQAVIALGGTLQTTISIENLKRIAAPTTKSSALTERISSNITDHLHKKKTHFKEELDVRGMRALDALQSVDYFLDEAIQVNAHRVRILHGTGTGALRVSIREMLATKPFVLRFYDEDVRFGGAGITVVEL